MNALPSQGYSATVDAWLLVGNHKLFVKRVGGGMLMVKDPQPVPAATPATVVLSIDGREQSMAIVLDQGIVPGVEAITYTEIRSA